MRSGRANGGRRTHRRAARPRRLRAPTRRSRAAGASGASSCLEQPVAHAANGLDDVRPVELLAQLRNVNVDGAGSARKRDPPDFLEQPVARHDATCVPRELREELELERAQLDRGAVNRDGAAAKVDAQLAELERDRKSTRLNS